MYMWGFFPMKKKRTVGRSLCVSCLYSRISLPHWNNHPTFAGHSMTSLTDITVPISSLLEAKLLYSISTTGLPKVEAATKWHWVAVLGDHTLGSEVTHRFKRPPWMAATRGVLPSSRLLWGPAHTHFPGSCPLEMSAGPPGGYFPPSVLAALYVTLTP